MLVEKIRFFLEKDNVFLSGGAGVGKSYTTQLIKTSFIKEGKKVISLGSTAISALNIGGMTLHSFFCFGICANLEELLSFDKKQRKKLEKLHKQLKKTELIIIDEISMVSAKLFDMIGFRLRDFEGKILVLGDFFQLPPVLKDEKKRDLFSSSNYAFSSLYWQSLSFKNLLLSLSKRTKDKEFYKNLSALRTKNLSPLVLEYFKSFLAPSSYDLSDDFTMLCSTNKKADFINEQKLSLLEGDFIELVAKEDKKELSQEQYNKWLSSLTIQKKLRLKIGAKIIFCVNSYDNGYYNGEQGFVKNLFTEDEELILEIQKNNDELIFLKPYTFKLINFTDEEDEVLASFTQFPIKPAYAITIHKSQGMSIEKLACDIDYIFEKGQLYVALSRSSEPKSLVIIYSNPKNFNTYFKEALKIDELVFDFYKKNEFIMLEENEEGSL